MSVFGREIKIKLGNQLRWSRASTLVLFFHRTTDLNCARPDIHSSSPSFVLPIQIGRHRCYLFIYFLFLFFTKKFQLNWPHFNLLIVVHSFCDRDLILAQIHSIYSNNLTNNLFWDDFISMSICYISVLWFGSFLLFVVVFRTTIKTKQNRKTIIKRNWPGFGGRISSQIHTGHRTGSRLFIDICAARCGTIIMNFHAKHWSTIISFQVIKAKQQLIHCLNNIVEKKENQNNYGTHIFLFGVMHNWNSEVENWETKLRQ